MTDLYDELCNLSDPSEDDLFHVDCVDCGEPTIVGFVCEECDVQHILEDV